MRVSVIGTGYVGLVSGACLAELGHEVLCVDVDQEKVEKINRGIAPIYEKGLDDLLVKHIGRRLRATTDLRRAVLDTELSMIAVGTPFSGDKIDLGYVKEASRQIGEALREKERYHMIVVKSTVVPGTTDDVVTPAVENASGKKAGVDFGMGMNPEFLREGEAVGDFMHPDRIVMGSMDDKSMVMLEKLYQPFTSVDKVQTNSKTAETIKYTSNALLATLISFSNEIANFCSAAGGIDVADVMKGVHLDKRLSPILDEGTRIVPTITTYLEAGCGFGGSCFPKDVKALISHGKKMGQPMHLLDSVIRINNEQPQKILHLLDKHFSSCQNLTVGVLGLAFKPGTDDMRESPAIPVIKGLIARGAQIMAFDPVAKHAAQQLFNNRQILFVDEVQKAVNGVDAVILLTRWDEFKQLHDIVKGINPQPLVIDGRRMLDKTSFERYEGIGLGSIS